MLRQCRRRGGRNEREEASAQLLLWPRPQHRGEERPRHVDRVSGVARQIFDAPHSPDLLRIRRQRCGVGCTLEGGVEERRRRRILPQSDEGDRCTGQRRAAHLQVRDAALGLGNPRRCAIPHCGGDHRHEVCLGPLVEPGHEIQQILVPARMREREREIHVEPGVVELVTDRLVLRHGFLERCRIRVAQAVLPDLEQEGELASSRDVLDVELLRRAVGGDGGPPVVTRRAEPTDEIVLQRPAQLAVRQRGGRLDLDRPARLRTRQLAHAAGQEGPRPLCVMESLSRVKRHERPELVERLAHPARGEVCLANLVEDEGDGRFLGQLPNRLLGRFELLRRDAGRSRVEPERRDDLARRRRLERGRVDDRTQCP